MSTTRTGKCPHGEFDLMEGCPKCIADRMGKEGNTEASIAEAVKKTDQHIVKVQYHSETTGKVSPREYTYYSADRLNVGDIVTVPVRDTTGKAKVSSIDVPEEEIANFKDKVKIIPAGSVVEGKPSLPAGGLAEAAQKAGAEVHVVAFENIAKNLGLIPRTDKIEQERESTDYGKMADESTYLNEPDETETAIARLPVEQRALVRIEPLKDAAVFKLLEEAAKLQQYAEKVVVATVEDVKTVTNDLTIIKELRKQIEEKRKEYLDPVTAHATAIRDAFKLLLTPLEIADKLERDAILAYRQKERDRIAAEEEARELRRRASMLEAEARGEEAPQEIVVQSAEQRKMYRSDIGTTGSVQTRTWEVEDLSLIPLEYMVPDAQKIGKVIRAGGSIPGIKVKLEESLRVTSKKSL